MNKVFHINLGGYPFTIDEDAYSHLTGYLASIENHFRHSEGSDEIVQDIEIRLAELIHESTENNPIVTMREVERAIAIMGTPEEFESEGMDEFSTRESYQAPKFKTGKRLYRDPDDKVLGGVCSGMSAYFGINDPIWLRLAFILITVSGGAGLLIYIVLWIVMPEAKSAADRLSMRGEDINVTSIAKMVEEGVDSLTSSIEDITGDLRSKKKAKEEQILVETPLPAGLLY